MMKCLLFLLLLTGCSASVPKYRFGQQVKFKPNSFYKNACRDVGTITRYISYSDVSYFVEVLNYKGTYTDPACSSWVLESDIIKIEKEQ